jgi:hypothetical protein
MNSPNSTRDELSLERRFFLFDKIMREFDGFVVCSVDLVPHEAVNIFTLAFNFIENVFNRLECVLCLLAASVEQRCKLLEFISVKKINVHHVYKRSTVVKLLLRFIELKVKLFKTLIAERLADGVDESFKVEREGRPKSF